MLSKSLKILGLTLASVALVACSTATTETAEDGPIKVGAIMPLTGDAASYGTPMQAVAQIAIDEINEAGGVNGRMLEFIWEDGKCNGKDAASAAQKLVNVDKVEVIFGGFCSPEVLGIAPIVNNAQVVSLSSGASSPAVTDAGDFVFRNYPSDTAQAGIIAGIANDMGLEKVALLTEENDYPIGIADAFIENFNGEVVSETFLPTEVDFKTVLTKLKGEGADALFINPQTGPKADLILKQLQQLGSDDMQLFGNDVIMASTDILTQYSELTEGMIGAQTSYEADNPKFVTMSATYKERTGESEVPFASYAATTYDAVYLLAAAFEDGAMGGTALRDWLYKVKDWPGTAGSLTLDKNGEPGASHRPNIVKDGKATEFDPAASMEEETTEEAAE